MIRWLEQNKEVSFFLMFLIIIEIFFFSSIPGTKIKGEANWIPTIYHFTIFFLFAFFILITIKGNKKIKKSYVFITIIFSLCQAFLDEFHQFFVPLRSCSFEDLMIDSLGIFSAIIVYYLSYKKRINYFLL